MLYDKENKVIEHSPLRNVINYPKPLVSVCITAYNIGDYIGECIDSILSQVVTFDYKILIGEDMSLDNTREILKEYELKYPDKVRVIYNSQNIGLMPNFVNTIESARGNFIAVMDGDDIWLNTQKLQSQVEFLLENEDYSLCFHDAIISDKNLVPLTSFSERYPNRFRLYNQRYSLEDIIKWRGILSGTSSIVFRKNFDKFPKWAMKVGGSESMIFILLFTYGKFHYIKEAMSVYRTHQHSTERTLSKISKSIRDIKDYNIYLKEFYPICRLFLIKKILRNRFYIIYQSIKSNQPKELIFSIRMIFPEITKYVYFLCLDKITK